MLYEPPENLTPRAPTLWERGRLIVEGRPLAEAMHTFVLCYRLPRVSRMDALAARVPRYLRWHRETIGVGTQ